MFGTFLRFKLPLQFQPFVGQFVPLGLHHPGGGPPRSSKERATERRALAAAKWFLENHADHVPWHQGTTKNDRSVNYM